VITKGKMSWAWHVAHGGRGGGEERCIQGFGGTTCRIETIWKTKA